MSRFLKPALVLGICFFVSSCGDAKVTNSQILEDLGTYKGSTFSELWSQLTSDRYLSLPKNKITLSSFGLFTQSRLKRAAKRTLSDRSDLLPRFNKLLHPNGICLAGKWSIDQETPFTGYFKKNSEALIIARASVALSETTVGNYRGFGLAGKLIPTTNPSHTEKLKTANFFTADDLGGTKKSNYTDALLLNKPKVSTFGRGAYITAIGAVVGTLFNLLDSNSGVRQLYEISELGMTNPKEAVTPKFMRLMGTNKNKKLTSKADFRDDLRMENFDGPITFSIELSADEKEWKRVGSIEFNQDAASDSCDHRLHFHHPKTRKNLKFARP